MIRALQARALPLGYAAKTERGTNTGPQPCQQLVLVLEDQIEYEYKYEDQIEHEHQIKHQPPPRGFP